MKELTLVVLAAGLGSRYGGLKQIEPLGAAGVAGVEDAEEAGDEQHAPRHETEADPEAVGREGHREAPSRTGTAGRRSRRWGEGRGFRPDGP